MITINHRFNEYFLKIKEVFTPYKLSEFIVSAFVFEFICVIAMTAACVYGINTDTREIIVFTLFNGSSSFLLFGLILWMIKKGNLPDTYYSWSISINYGASFLLIPYVLFIDHKAVLAISMLFFFINIFNFCVLLHILNFRSNHHHNWNALRKLTPLKNSFKFKLTMGLRLHVIMPIGLVSFHFDTVSINGVDYDLFNISKYFETHELDLNSLSTDDLLLWDMIRY